MVVTAVDLVELRSVETTRSNKFTRALTAAAVYAYFVMAHIAIRTWCYSVSLCTSPVNNRWSSRFRRFLAHILKTFALLNAAIEAKRD